MRRNVEGRKVKKPKNPRFDPIGKRPAIKINSRLRRPSNQPNSPIVSYNNDLLRQMMTSREIQTLIKEGFKAESNGAGYKQDVSLIVGQNTFGFPLDRNYVFRTLDKAIKANDLENVKHLLSVSGGLDLFKDNKWSLLRAPALKGNIDMVRALVEAGEDPNKEDNHRCTPVFDAASEGHLNIVKYLVEEKEVDPSKENTDGRTPVFIAAWGGHLNVVKYLVGERGVDASAGIHKGEGPDPIYVAAYNGHLDVVRYLVEDVRVESGSWNPLVALPKKIIQLLLNTL